MNKTDLIDAIASAAELNKRAARTGRNPQTGAEIKIAASKVPAFVSGKALKDAIK